MSKKIQLSKRMPNYVTICRVSRRGVFCLAGLFASQVISQNLVWVENFPSVQKVEPDNGTRWTVRVEEETDFANDVSNCAKLSEFILKSLNDGFRSYSNSGTQFSSYFIGVGSDSEILHRKNMGQLGYMDSINNQLTQSSIMDGGNAYTTLFGLLAGWSPNSVPNVDGIPYGAETNGIWYFTKDLSDALHNTNSVFHRQLTVQETLTNQMERFLTHTSNYLQRISYQISNPYNVTTTFGTTFFRDEDFYYNSMPGNALYDTESPVMLLSSLPQYISMLTVFDHDDLANNSSAHRASTELYTLLTQVRQNNSSLPGNRPAALVKQISDVQYDRYGTKWGFDSITNILLSQDFDFNSISTVKPEVDDMIQDSIEEVQDSLPSSDESQEDVIPPGDYEEIQDERIDTSFLEEAKTDTTSIKFSEHLFDDFKSSYNGIFNFRSSSSLQYSFSLQSSDGVNVSVNDTDMLGNASQLLSEKKPTIDALIKIIIGLNKFICLVVLVGKSFKMVSEIFSS